MTIAVLSGGVGGARFLRALARVVDPARIVAIVNTGDDRVFHGLTVCPDLDSVIYALADENDPERGWGLAGESFRAFEALRRFEPDAWFQLGDRDLATHLHRSARLAEGLGLAEVTAGIATAFGLRARVLPVTQDRLSTRVATERGELDFQQYHVRERSEPRVQGVRYEGASEARPAPGVREAIAEASAVLVGPSNPISSIGPIVAVPGMVDALCSSAARVVALSGLRGGAPFRGDADRLMAGVGLAVSPLAVAERYAPWLDGLVVDEADRDCVGELTARGLLADAMDTRLDGAAGEAVAARCLRLALEGRA